MDPSEKSSRAVATSFLQARLTLLTKSLAVITFLGSIPNAVFNPEGHLGHPTYWWLLSIAVCFAVAWLIYRARPLRRRTLWFIEWMLNLAVVTCVAMFFRAGLLEFAPEAAAPAEGNAQGIAALVAMAEKQLAMGVTLGLSYMLILRAALVPSHPRHALALSVGMGILWVASLFFPVALPGLDFDRTLAPEVGLHAEVLVWWVLMCIVVFLISKIVHGLHEQVRAARQLGPYQLESKLGEGGMGVVYRAKHALMRRPTAIKLLQPTKSSPEHVTRFEREVQLTARLTHPNTITIFDYGRAPDGVFYYAMELLDGATLDEVVRVSGPLSAARTLHVLRAVVGALNEAHAIGLIHRDIKPANIMLCRQGQLDDVPKLLDFGLVRDVSEEDTRLTRDETITGTPMYISPEAITHPTEVDARSDVYALGAVAYFMLTGTELFSANTIVELCAHHLHTVPEPPSARSEQPIPEDLEQIVVECLRKDRNERPSSAEVLLDRLDACMDAGKWSASDARRWWQEHGQQLSLKASEVPSVGTRTIAVQLERDGS